MKVVGSSNLPLDQLAGSSKAVILGSGFGTTAAMWDVAQKHLNPELDYLRFDLPGHGISPAVTESFTVEDLADAVITLADSLDINRFCYAGVSLGGAIGLTLALKYPKRVKAVLSICSAPKFGDSSAWIQRSRSVRDGGTAQFAEATRDRWFSQRFQLRKPGLVEQAMQMLRDVDRESYALGCEALAKYDISNQLGEINTPVMVISGELDPVVLPEQALNYSRQLNDGSIIEVLGVSHQAVFEAPEVLAKHINFSALQNK